MLILSAVKTILPSRVSGTADAKKKQQGRTKEVVAEHRTIEASLLVSSSLDNDDRCMGGLLIWCHLVEVESPVGSS